MSYACPECDYFQIQEEVIVRAITLLDVDEYGELAEVGDDYDSIKTVFAQYTCAQCGHKLPGITRQIVAENIREVYEDEV